MANQITHIVLAEKMSDKLFEKFNREDFLIGTVFPDIRYLKVIGRDQTHFKNLTFQNILDEQDSFAAGMKYHSLVDETIEKYMVQEGIYDLVPPSKIIMYVYALKNYDDEILYSNVLDWGRIVNYLNFILPGEISLVKQEEEIKKWHSLIQTYIKEKPADMTRENFILGIGFGKDVVIEINNLIVKMRNNPIIHKIIVGMYENWELLLG